MAQPNDKRQPFQINGIDVITSRGILPISEGVGWFAITQGGFYSNGGTLYGLRIGDSPSNEEFLNDRTLITRLSHRGGNGRTHFLPRLNAATKTKAEKGPIGVIISNKHPCLEEATRKHLGKSHSHALLGGWWLLSDFWTTRDNQGVEILMARLDKCDFHDIWWTTNISSPGDLTSSHAPPAITVCATCQRTSPVRYRRGFQCDNSQCPTNQGPISNAGQDSSPYLDTYLKWRPQMDSIAASRFPYLPVDRPNILTKADLQAMKADPSCRRPGWTAFLCKKCNSINMYYRWGKLKCRICKHSEPSPIPMISFDDLAEAQYMDLKDDSEIPGVKVVPGGAEEILPRLKHADYVIRRWKLSDTGQVGLVVPKKHIIDAPGGPRDTYQQIWYALNRDELKYKRFRLKSSQVSEQRVAWMGQNVGEPYAAVMRMDESNIPLDKAPGIIKSVLSRLNARSQDLFGKDPGFNEILCMASLPEMKMGWHDDGEEVIVGDVVMSEQLGSTGMMSFGMKQRYYAGKSQHGDLHPDDPVIRGAAKENARNELKQKLEKQEITTEEYQARLSDVLKDVKHSTEPHKCLTFPLPGNGSFMFQYGIDVNKYWKHKVENTGLLRFVNTARTLRVSTQAPGQPRDYGNDHPPDDSDSADSKTGDEDDTKKMSKRKRPASTSTALQPRRDDKDSPELPGKRQRTGSQGLVPSTSTRQMRPSTVRQRSLTKK